MLLLALYLVTGTSVIIYFYVSYAYSHWQRRGIPYLRPSFPFGNFTLTSLQKCTIGERLAELYRSTTEPFVGIFMLQNPLLLVRDPKLIRSILVKDFHCFTDHDFYLNEKDEPLTGQLGALRGQRWRDMRTKLTPAFSPNKMKMIFAGLLECGCQLQQQVAEAAKAKQAIDMYELIACFSTSVMASTVYGIDGDCLANPNHPFRCAGRQIFEINTKNSFRFVGWFYQQTLLKWSGLRFVDRTVEHYFLNLVAQTLEMREQKNIERNDFFQMLVELRNANGDEMKSTKNTRQKSLTFEQVAAQAFAFFIPGFKSTSLTTSYCLYEIAKHSDIQRKIHEEIDRVVAQCNGQLTFESINELSYLDCCINETLRKHQLIDLSRVCVKDYKIPGTNVTIEKGTSIVIPTFALHHDERFYPDPEKFDPMRFKLSKYKTDKSLNDAPYLPFGGGPRNCIGQRMGKMFVKVGICSILQQYDIELDDRHIGREMKLSLNLHPIGGIHLKFKSKK